MLSHLVKANHFTKRQVDLSIGPLKFEPSTVVNHRPPTPGAVALQGLQRMDSEIVEMKDEILTNLDDLKQRDPQLGSNT